ncbi:MAG: hypothetical protein H0W68_07725 [Gemmatimonadaceae bacterium]|nr:hypothetical protein [Gemmatimonadaceae bacterium]
MTRTPPRTGREPVQVYLDAPDRAILERSALATGLPRAEVLRRGLRRFAAELLAEESPALAFLAAASAISSAAPRDVAARHDEYLADWEMASWRAKPKVKAASRARK